jgi:hypothetical protein
VKGTFCDSSGKVITHAFQAELEILRLEILAAMNSRIGANYSCIRRNKQMGEKARAAKFKPTLFCQLGRWMAPAAGNRS